MHAATQLLTLWSFAFATLCAAVLLLNIFDGVIGNELSLHAVGTEAAIAGFASLVEGVGLWLVLSFAPGASRALIIPAIIVALIYKIGHLEDWSKIDALMLLFFQAVIGFFASSLLSGHFRTAIYIFLAFAVILAAIGSFAKNFD